jgi:hypothetical protein
MNVIQGEDWRALILAYLHHYYKPDTIVEQMRMQQRARAYQIVDNDLYKILVSGPSFAVLAKKMVANIVRGAHRSMCRSHWS